MKKLNLWVALVLLLITACEKETLTVGETEGQIANESENFSGYVQSFAAGEVVIKYDATTTETEKQNLRNSYGVTNYKNCTCADPTLELWIFELDRDGNILGGGSVEGVVESSKDNSGVEGSELNPIIKQGGYKFSAPFGPEDMGTAVNLMAGDNTGVTIAVLDTGIDYNYFGFDTPFLYNSMDGSAPCEEGGMSSRIGWDFVESDNNPFDYHGHGTQVTSMIYDRLKNENVDFQILPIRVFDENGDARYFDVLCGFKYAINHDDVEMINMSFGWYYTQYQILGEFIQHSQDDVVLITSAGNLENDNDIIPHYPSSYETENLLAVASWNSDIMNVGLSHFSNHGEYSVDIAARGEEIPFYITPSEYIFLSGTSYSAAIVSAYGASVHVPNMHPQEHISYILSAGIPDDALHMIKYHSYIYY